MSIELGLFMGACMFIAYRWGRFVERKVLQNTVNLLLSRMDKDLDGAVEDWFKHNAIRSN
jgi:hypothetical protein